MPVVKASLTLSYCSFINTSVIGARRRISASISPVIKFLLLDLTHFIVEDVLSHMHVF